jgi:predicted nucleic acid-binding protein
MLIALPQIVWLEESAGLESYWQTHARRSVAAPKVWMDADLAAFARGHGISLATLDEDFKKFGGLSVKYLVAP